MHDKQKSKNTEMINGLVKLPKRKKLTTAAYYQPPQRFDNLYLSLTKEEFERLKRQTKGDVLINWWSF